LRKFGIFPKVFVYTTLFLGAVIAITVGLFYQQFSAFYQSQQMQQLRVNYQALYEELHDAVTDRQLMIEIAQRFSEGNQSFVFRLMDDGQAPIFLSHNIVLAPEDIGTRMIFTFGGYTLVAENPVPTLGDGGFWVTAVFALGIIMMVALVGAAVFARQMTIPIKRSIVGLEEEIKRRTEMEEAQRYFFSAASHELKTPVAAARVMMEGMLAEIGDYKNHPKYLGQCINLMDEQSKTIYEILDIVNLDGHYEPQFESVNIKAIVLEQVEIYRPMADAAKQELVMENDMDVDSRVDTRLLRKVLSNVMLNAIQNAPEGGCIHIYMNDFRLCVLNTGHVDDESLSRLFDPFYRMDKARSRKSGQTGLGLTIVKKSLDLMDMKFGLENTDSGVLFWMDLMEA